MVIPQWLILSLYQMAIPYQLFLTLHQMEIPHGLLAHLLQFFDGGPTSCWALVEAIEYVE